jgi:hypothetical protein
VLAAGVVAAVVAVMALVGVLAAHSCVRLIRRRLDRRIWDDLIARNRDLDWELTRIWRGR